MIASNDNISFRPSDRAITRVPKVLAAYLGISRRSRKPGDALGTSGCLFEGRGDYLLAGGGSFSAVELSESEGGSAIRVALTKSSAGARAELVPLSPYLREGKFSYYEVPLSYEFDLRLDAASVGEDATQCLAQWHGIPNRALGSTDAHAPFFLGLSDGQYFCVSVASSRLVLPPFNKKDPFDRYEKVKRIPLCSAVADVDRWTKWRFDVKWSFRGANGWWRLYRDNNLLVEDAGPNCFNELRGAPYFQFGVYRMGANGTAPPALTREIVRYYRKVRISVLPA